MLYLYLSSFNIYIQVLSVVRGHWDTIVVPRPCSATVCGWAPQFQQENLPQGSMATWSLWHGYMIWKPKTSGSSSIWKKKYPSWKHIISWSNNRFYRFFPHFLVCLPHSKPRAELRCWCSSCLVWTNES